MNSEQKREASRLIAEADRMMRESNGWPSTHPDEFTTWKEQARLFRSDTEKQTDSVLNSQIEMMSSFYSSLSAVGGNPATIVRLDMTLQDMLETLAQNGIRFTYKGRKPR